MIQYIREFALKNTVRVIFELFTYWNWGWGLELELVCKFEQFCRPLANDIKVAIMSLWPGSVKSWSRFSGHSAVTLWVDITLQTQC